MNRQQRRHPDRESDESPKQHVDNPPRDTGSPDAEPEHPRGREGQFTGEGDPGLQKR